MRHAIKNKDTGVVHEAVREGDLMLTKCGLSVKRGTGRWYQRQFEERWISCRKCKKG